MRTIAQNICYYRNKKQLTQQQLADKLNVSHHTISKWECGNNTPSVEDLKRLAQLFGLTLDELTNNNDKLAIKDIRTFLDIGESKPEKELPELIFEAYRQIFAVRGFVPSTYKKQTYIMAQMAYALYYYRTMTQECKQAGAKVKAEEWRKDIAAGFTYSMFKYNPESLREEYKSVPLDSFAIQFYTAFELA